MENNENLVLEGTENVEQTTEQTQQPVKTYTQEEVNEIVGKAKARARAKAEKEINSKYEPLIATLEEGSGYKGVEDLNKAFTEHYTAKGRIKKDPIPNYSTSDIETLARADAEDIINNGGYEEVVEEVDRLTKKGVENMTAREKAMFKVLAEHRQNAERGQELSKIGVTEDVYNSQEFKDFQSMFKEDTPITKVYEQYQKTQPKKQIQTMGSMKNSTADNGAVKDFYSY